MRAFTPGPELAGRYYWEAVRTILDADYPRREAIASAIWDTIEDAEVQALPYGLGKIDQYVSSTDVLSHTERCRKQAVLYTE